MTDDRTHLFSGSRWTAPSGGNRITVRCAPAGDALDESTLIGPLASRTQPQ